MRIIKNFIHKHPDWFLVILWILAIALLCSIPACTTQKKVNNWLNKHPLEAAEYCADAFPVKDSTGTTVIDSTKKADNKDHTNEIDSLNREIKTLEGHVQAIIEAGENDVDLVQGALRKEILKLQQQLSQLKAKAEALQSNYKPCLPDTVYKTTPVYRENTAKVDAYKIKLAMLQQQFDDIQKSRKVWRGRAVWTWSILALIAALAGAYKLFKAKLPIKIG